MAVVARGRQVGHTIGHGVGFAGTHLHADMIGIETPGQACTDIRVETDLDLAVNDGLGKTLGHHGPATETG